jgi:xanthine dehydrogenase accessory factor
MTVIGDQAAVIGGWLREGRQVARAVLVDIDGSAPLSPGASMYVAGDGAIEGSITGGCVESAVVMEAEEVLAGKPPRLVTYGISDELAGTAGLTCGGIVHIFVHALDDDGAAALEAALDEVAAGRPSAVATLLDGDAAGALMAVIPGGDGDAREADGHSDHQLHAHPAEGRVIGSLGGPGLLTDGVARDAGGLLEQGLTALRGYGADGSTLGAGVRVHITSFASRPQMLIFGAIDFSAALTPLALELGYRVTISDPRERFVKAPRFARADEVHVGWPDDAFAGRRLGPRDAVIVFSHDRRLDVPALKGALATRAGYIGALGSRRTTAERNERLREAGVSEEEIARVYAPCGLDIGGGTPGETAVSILAEIVSSRSQRRPASLRETHGAIQPHVGARDLVS